MQEDTLNPIIVAKKSLELQLQNRLDEAAILRKKISALEDALNVLRATDSELRSMPERENRQRVLDADPELIQSAISELVSKQGKVRISTIMNYLSTNEILHSEYAVKKVLRQNFRKIGERDRTYYAELTCDANGARL